MINLGIAQYILKIHTVGPESGLRLFKYSISDAHEDVGICDAGVQLLDPLGFEGAQHRQTLRPTVDGIRSKALRPFGLQ